MNKNIYYTIFLLLLFNSSCSSQNINDQQKNINTEVAPTEYNLDDYLKSSSFLDNRVNKIFSQLNDTSMVTTFDACNWKIRKTKKSLTAVSLLELLVDC